MGQLNDNVVVMVVEDEPDVRSMVLELLGFQGFEVLGAEHSAHAIELLIGHAVRVQALFTDVNMPGTMDGVMLSHHVRHHWPWISIIVTSARPLSPAHKLPDGARFILKPYLLTEVAKQIIEMRAAR